MAKYFLLCLLVLSQASIAGGWITKDGTGKITSISSENGVVIVGYTADDGNLDPETCSQPGHAVLVDDTKNGDRQFSILLAAKMSGKPVKMYASECYFGWGRKWSKIWMVLVE